MRVFVAYPYALDVSRKYRFILEREFRSSSISLVFANDTITSRHILNKVDGLLRESDLCVFDLTDCNANVMLELGIAIALDLPYIVALRQDRASTLASDIHGWDRINYLDEISFAQRLLELIASGKVPKKVPNISSLSLSDFRDINFGLQRTPDLDVDILGHARSLQMAAAFKPTLDTGRPLRSLVNNAKTRYRDLVDCIVGAINENNARYYWSSGFSPVEHEDRLEITTGDTWLTAYRDGTITYSRSERSSSPLKLRPELISEIIVVTNAILRKLYSHYDLKIPELAFLFTISPPAMVRLDLTRSDFVPMRYEGVPFANNALPLLHVPSEPILLSTNDDHAVAETVSEVDRVIRTLVVKVSR